MVFRRYGNSRRISETARPLAEIGRVPLWKEEPLNEILFRPGAAGLIEVIGAFWPDNSNSNVKTNVRAPSGKPWNPRRRLQLFAPNRPANPVAIAEGKLQAVRLRYQMTANDVGEVGAWRCTIEDVEPAGPTSPFLLTGAAWRVSYPVRVYTATFDHRLFAELIHGLSRSLNIQLHINSPQYGTSITWDPGLTDLLPIPLGKFPLFLYFPIRKTSWKGPVPVTTDISVDDVNGTVFLSTPPAEGQRLSISAGLRVETEGSEIEVGVAVPILPDPSLDINLLDVRLIMHFTLDHPALASSPVPFVKPVVAISYDLGIRATTVIPGTSKTISDLGDFLRNSFDGQEEMIAEIIEKLLASIVRLGPRQRIYSVFLREGILEIKYYDHVRGEDLI